MSTSYVMDASFEALNEENTTLTESLMEAVEAATASAFTSAGNFRNYGERREAEISVLQKELVFVTRSVAKLRKHSNASTEDREKIFRLLDELRLRERQVKTADAEIVTLNAALGGSGQKHAGRSEILELMDILAEAKSEKLYLLKTLSDADEATRKKEDELSAFSAKMEKIGDVGQHMTDEELLEAIAAVRFDCEDVKERERVRAVESSGKLATLERELAQLRSAGEATTAASSRERCAVKLSRKSVLIN
jgi:hypothetical protein